MLLDRNQPGDKEKATTLLNEAIEMYIGQLTNRPSHGSRRLADEFRGFPRVSP